MTPRKKRSRGGWRLRLAVVLGMLAIAAVLWSFDALPPVSDWMVDDTRYHEEIAAAAGRHGLDPELVRSLIFRESRFNERARGGAGEVGLMQVLPSGAAAEWARVEKRPRPSVNDLFDVRLNLEIGCWYLARAMRRWSAYDHRIELALAQYNAGERRVQKWAPADRSGEVVGRITVASTRKYVTNIMKRYRKYALRRGTPARGVPVTVAPGTR